jgi:hypothetical protein
MSAQMPPMLSQATSHHHTMRPQFYVGAPRKHAQTDFVKDKSSKLRNKSTGRIV